MEACLGRRGLLSVFVFAFALAAQNSPTGSFRGNVVDPSGASISGASLRLRNVNSGAARTGTSDAAGQFHFVGLPVGSYSLHVEQAGFAPVDLPELELSIGQTLVREVTLRLASSGTTLDVVEQEDSVAAEATASVAMGEDRIEEAPAANRNFLNFVLVAPGVAPSSNTGRQRTMGGVRSPMADSGFSFAGFRPRNNSISIDGVDNRDETTGGNRVAVGLEMVQEFRSSGVSDGAELGGAAGGIVNMVTRSGTNLWHGDFTFFTQNEATNARGPEVEVAPKAKFRRLQPGVSINGPIAKDRTFFSTAVEYERESAEEFSESPAALLLPINRALQGSLYSAAPVRQLFRGLFPVEARGQEFSLKLNHQIDPKNSLNVRYAFSRGRLSGDVQGTDNFEDRSARGNSFTRDHSLALQWLSVRGASRVNDIRLQLAQRAQQFQPNAIGPLFEIPGLLSFGQSSRLDAQRTEQHEQFVENFEQVLGAHRLSLGVDLHRIGLDSRLANRYHGLYVFPTLDAFLQGQPDLFLQAFGDPRTSMGTLACGAWLQERWQVNRALLLEAGLRFDRQRMPRGLPSSSNNFAPRLGLALRPFADRPFVIRAGFGLFFDRYPLAFLNEALQKNGQGGFEQYAVGPLAAAVLAGSRGNEIGSPLPGLARSLYQASNPFSSTYSRKLNFGVEQGIGRDTTVTVEANFVRGFHLPRLRNASGQLPPQYLLEQSAKSAYRGLSLSLNRRMSNEFALLLSYGLGRALDDGSDYDEQPNDPADLQKEWARSRQYQRHRLAISTIFNLPAEEVLSGPKWLQEALSDISIAPVVSAGSGRPINALLTSDVYRTGAYPLSARPLEMPRNSFLTQPTFGVDLRAMKTIPMIDERAKLQFGVESFNLLNHTNVARVSPFFAAGDQRLPTFGKLVEAQNGRQVQLFIQLEY